MKGTVISRTLAEAGLTPMVGMQVYFDGVIGVLNRPNDRHPDTHWIINPAGFPNNMGYDFAPVSELKTLLVKYDGGRHKFMGDYDEQILPLKYSDWQTVVEQGLVDSGKEVEWNHGTDYYEWLGKDKPRGVGYVKVATLIPQQDDVKKLAQKWTSDRGMRGAGLLTNGSSGFRTVEDIWVAGYQIAKSLQQQNTDIIEALKLCYINLRSMTAQYGMNMAAKKALDVADSCLKNKPHPVQQDDVEKLANELYPRYIGYRKNPDDFNRMQSFDHNEQSREGFIVGYQAAKAKQKQKLNLAMPILLLMNYRDTFKESQNGHQECQGAIDLLEKIQKGGKI